MGFTRSGLRRYALLLGAISAGVFALAIANHTDNYIGGGSWTYVLLAFAGMSALFAASNLVLSRALDEDGQFVRRADEPPTAPLLRGFPLWLHLPMTAGVALIFVLVGVGVSWWVAGIFVGPLLAIDLVALLALLASKLDDVRRGRARGGGGEGRV
jgi:hypothetical protein